MNFNISTDSRINRRKSDRLVANMEINYSDGRLMFFDKLNDISMTGIQVEAPKELKSGTPVIVTVPSSPPVKIRGTVRWTSKNGFKHRIGIQFDSPTMDQKVGLREVIQALSWR